MALAIERLAQALKQEAAPDPQTAQVVQQIEQQISEMMREQQYEDEEDLDSEYSGPLLEEDEEIDGTIVVQPMPHTELPHYPTPWELWKKAHGNTEKPPQAPILTEKEWSRLVKSLNDSSKERQLSLMRKQHKHIAKELAGLNFKPRINPLSREMAAENLRIYEGDRLRHVVDTRAEKLHKARIQLQQEEISKCTFQPNLTKKARKVSRNVEDLMMYGEIKRHRMLQRRQYHQDLEDRELTFKPHINQKSLRIVQRMKSRPTGGRRGITNTNEDPGHGEDTFSPKINRRSRGLKQKGKVFDRLYNSAQVQNQRRLSNQEDYIKTHIRGATVSPMVSSKRSPPGGKRDLSRAPQGPNNVVRYRPKYDFILKRFGMSGTAS